MADTQQNEAQKEPVTETQDAPMPSADEKTTPVEGQGQVKQDDVQRLPEVTPTGELPDGVKERTQREFEKLTSQLHDEKQQRQRLEDIFKTIATPVQQSVPQQPQQVPVYDPTTGLLNEDALAATQKAAWEASQRAVRAEEAVQRYVQDQEAREAFQAHPELDPQGRFGKEFDQELHVATRRILTDAMLNPTDYGGRQLSFKDAGDLAKRQIQTKVDAATQVAKEEGAKEAIEAIAPKEQAALEAEGASGRVVSLPADEQELIMQSRKGNIDAMAARVSRFRKQGKS